MNTGTDSKGIKLTRDILRDSINTSRRDHLRRMQLHLLGFVPLCTPGTSYTDRELAWDRYFASLPGGTQSTNFGGTFGSYGLMQRGPMQYLRPNDMLNNTRIRLAQTRAVDIVPEWTGTSSELQLLARKAWWQQRSQGIDGEGGWKDDLDRAYMDFSDLGLGVLRLAVCEYEDGARVGPKYVSPLDCLFDPYAPSVEDSSFVAFATLMGIREAAKRFPDFDFEHAQTTPYYSGSGVMMEGVRIIESFSRAGYDIPTYAAFVDNVDGEMIEEGENPFEDLPYGAFPNFQPPGSDSPIGLVEMSLYEAVNLEEQELVVQRQATRDAQIIIDEDLIHPDDMQKMVDGDDPMYIRRNPDQASQTDRPPVMEVPRRAINQDRYQWIMMLKAGLDEKSGIGANAAGTAVEGDTTATEVNSINARLGAQASFLSREFARGYQSFAVKIGRAAKLWDTAPFMMTVQNAPVLFNSPQYPAMTSEIVWDGSLNALIGEEDLIKTDVNAKSEREVAKAMQWWQLTQSQDALIRVGEALGVRSPERDVQQMAPPMMAGAPPV